MVATRRYTTADLDTLPDPEEGARYEIIDGELIVSRQPTMGHQDACDELATVLRRWSRATGRGWAVSAPGVIFAEDQNVAPDVVWISTDRLHAALDERGHLRDAPELMVEVLSPGVENIQRDRGTKLDLYSRRGVEEYWVVDWQHHRIEVYRRADAAPDLKLVATLQDDDTLTSPMLPGFGVRVGDLFYWQSR
ncbi:MAG: hypothetical protein AVDCRST_MAG77-2890 [uncultured Chloroflexi bacterium]|uniref:Putative restriction endonuclease domain-containing protein n=1 Tax=uncultured Chloroflexota bacterium TaxID=166587 RepID=A0A6J4J4G9_9CHLR|nr:MAG: hypothetical protein AVDCRST_MAG77-2890 [uncultured Chloroflexota bacterium]